MVASIAVYASGSDTDVVVKVSLSPEGACCCPIYAGDTDGTIAADDHGYYFIETKVMSVVVLLSGHKYADAAP